MPGVSVKSKLLELTRVDVLAFAFAVLCTITLPFLSRILTEKTFMLSPISVCEPVISTAKSNPLGNVPFCEYCSLVSGLPSYAFFDVPDATSKTHFVTFNLPYFTVSWKLSLSVTSTPFLSSIFTVQVLLLSPTSVCVPVKLISKRNNAGSEPSSIV